MSEVFADTSGWANWLVRGQPFHAQAAAFINGCHTARTRLITTNYILTELVAVLTSPLRIPRPLQIALIEDIRLDPGVEIVHIDFVLDDEAWKLLKSRPDKAWSLVDCASFVVMQRRGITDALTADHHFEQASFTRLLK